MERLGRVRDRLRRISGRSVDRPGADSRDPASLFDPLDRTIIDEVRPHTMTSELRVEALLRAVRYVVDRGIPGALAECGVWRGGSVLAMARQLQLLGAEDRDLYLYDTFEGMTAPTDRDTSRFDPPALSTWREAASQSLQPWPELFNDQVFNEMHVASLLQSAGYPMDRVHLIKGPVETTLPDQGPDQLAVLRLDTDWYESTLHELVHLYPRLSQGGVLIIDDYGHWEGCRQAVDEYFSTYAPPLLLQRVDYTGRMGVKC